MKQGLTLIEVCIAILIVTALLLSMLGIFQQGYRFLGVARERTTAVNLAIGILEQCSDWTALEQTSPHPHNAVVNGTYSLSSITLNTVTYTCTVTIADGPYIPAELKLITADVSWSRGGRNFSVSLSTMKAELP